MFSETPELYDLIYTSMKDYGAEASQVAELVHKLLPDATRVLDVACGTGEHARYLSRDHGFDVDGIDIEPRFVELARQKNPNGTFTCANMVDFDLQSEYDVLLCLFSSIGYVQDVTNLSESIAAMLRHTAPSGYLIVEPWFEPGVLEHGRVVCVTAENEGTKVCRMSHMNIDGHLSHVTFEYVIGDSNGIRRASEVHTLGIFTRDEMMQAFTAAGASVEFDAEGLIGRGLYVARRIE